MFNYEYAANELQVSTPIGKCENYIKLTNNFMLPNKYLNEKIVQVSVQKLLSIFRQCVIIKASIVIGEKEY